MDFRILQSQVRMSLGSIKQMLLSWPLSLHIEHDLAVMLRFGRARKPWTTGSYSGPLGEAFLLRITRRMLRREFNLENY